MVMRRTVVPKVDGLKLRAGQFLLFFAAHLDGEGFHNY